MKLFHATALKLAASYLAIMMLLSIGFSTILYRISTAELNRGFRRPPVMEIFTSPQEFERFQRVQVAESSRKLRAHLVLLNLIVLIGGGIICYMLARKTLEPIEQAMDAQSRFTADASHELRTPLTAMQTEIEVALRNPKLSKDEALALLQSNLDEVGKLSILSESLLRLARIDGQGITLAPTPLQEIGVEAMNRALKTAQANKISIANKIGSHKASADAAALTEVVNILLDNAIKYSKPNTSITLTSHKVGQQVSLKVIDQGHGIKASDLPHIFDRFYRADPSRSKTRISGYGLGLSIAQHLVTLQGGSISAKSTPGKGSVFTVKLAAA